MTKKDFQLIAQTISMLSPVAGMSERNRQIVAEEFAEALTPTNPRFKRDLFIQAATGVVAVTARKALSPTMTVRAIAQREALARTLASDIAEDR